MTTLDREKSNGVEMLLLVQLELDIGILSSGCTRILKVGEMMKRKIQWGGNDAASAARAGHRDIVKWLYENTESRRNDEGTMTAAVGSGKIELVEWLQEKFDQGSYEGVQEAVAKGHFEMVKWMYENESYDDEIGVGTLLKAAENGPLAIVKWIVENDEEYCTKDSGDNEDDGFVFVSAGTLLKAAENGHLDIVKWIVENDEEYCAKDSGDNEDDGFVFGMVYPVTSLGGEASLSIHTAATHGHTEVAKYLYEHTARPNNEEEAERAERREYRTLKLMSRQLDKFDAEQIPIDTIHSAALKGHLDVVKWMYSEFAIKRGKELFGFTTWRKICTLAFWMRQQGVGIWRSYCICMI
ncbi:hypothetical protein PHMEG_00014383 [Phytophthora megakarya]|uniref:Uncharacterized protein n=1 Tax=Phytophthora megakarya TaxID=4795 RepID=A0A225W502_9STRA|nr:hypothetical protein PHMEG_00014383 [Phytophthora megakarya]